jgi:MoxR-like ATPase
MDEQQSEVPGAEVPLATERPIEQERAFASRIDLGGLGDAVKRVRSEVARVIVGQEEMIDQIIAAVLVGGHVLIEGVPGIAKTLTAKLVARTLSIDFSRIQFTPDLMPSDVIGTSIFNMKSAEFEFRRGPIFSNLVLIDEINRAPAKTQSALFEVMQERQITVDGQTYPMAPPFLVLATQNPIEQEGTYRLPEAQLDRFLFKVEAGYPTADEEFEILAGAHRRHDEPESVSIEPVMSGGDVVEYQRKTRLVHIDDNLMRYITQLTLSTRGNSALYLGASPRASLAIMAASKAFAAMSGRDFVTPEDIRRAVIPVLRHRIMLTPEKEMEGGTAEGVIKQIIERAEVPR